MFEHVLQYCTVAEKIWLELEHEVACITVRWRESSLVVQHPVPSERACTRRSFNIPETAAIKSLPAV